MSRTDRLRRVLICICHFTQNLAFHNAGWRNKKLIREREFWRRLNGNCLDIAVVEWCKLFGESKGKHYWRNIIQDQVAFKADLFTIAGGESRFREYVTEVRTYRDKFVAHLDDELVAHVPYMADALEVSRLYYKYVAEEVTDLGALGGLPVDIEAFYKLSLSQAKAEYENRT